MAASSPPSTIRVLDNALVRPAPPSPESETAFPLTFFDIFWLHAPPVQRVLLYRLTPDADVDAIVSNLKDSLSLALRAFYPLAGRLRLTPGTANRYELHYRPGDAVAFTVAEAEYNGDVGDEPREVSRSAALAPPLPEGGAVLALQATTLLLSGGLALGVTVHHASCDGAASTHFLRTWAWAAAGAQPPRPSPPVIDRTLVSDPRGLYDVFFPKASPPPPPSREQTSNQLFATFVLSKAHLQRVKDVVATEAATRGVTPPPRCSSLVAAFGLVWSCYHRAKAFEPVAGSSGGGAEAEKACLLFPVDHRSRMTPPLPATYLGNCVGPAFAIAPTDELAAGGVSGLWTACAAVAAAVQEAVAVDGMVLAQERFMEAAAATSMLTVAGSPRFRVYDLDFGFGRPAKVDIVSIARTGAISVAESPDGAGMEVGVSLPPDGMDAFQKCFADATAGLDAAGD